MKEYKITEEGYKNLLNELDNLNKQRKEVAQRLKEAKEYSGDLTENSEYEHAKNDQAFTEGRIEQINEILKNHVIIKKDSSNGTVELGSIVIIQGLEEKREKKYQIVSSVESDPEKNKISDESPLGSELVHKKVGDIIEVKTPQGLKKLKIIDIV